MLKLKFKCSFCILTKPVVHVTHYNRLVTVVYPLINYKRGRGKFGGLHSEVSSHLIMYEIGIIILIK